MGDAAAPRRARSIGDFVFSVFAAGLGLALLFATGRHLFAPPYADTPQAAMLRLAAPVAVVVRPAVAAPMVAARASRALPHASLGQRSRSALHSPSGRRTQARTSKPNGSSRHTPASALSSRSLALWPRPVSHHGESAGRARASNLHDAGAGTIARSARAAAHAAPLERFAAGRNVARGRSAASHGQTASRGRVAQRKFGVSRARGARARAVIEPPLGYDAQPALVVAPTAEQLDLGEVVLPTIRSRGRH